MGDACGDFDSQLVSISASRDLRALSTDDSASFQRYLQFLEDFLRTVRGTAQALACHSDVDSVLLKVYLQTANIEKLSQLVTSPNDCHLDLCASELRRHKRSGTQLLLIYLEL